MRGVGEELAHPCLAFLPLADRVLDLVEHLVERDAEPAGFRPRVLVLDPAGKVTGGDLSCRLAHPLQGLSPIPIIHQARPARAISTAAVTIASIRSSWSSVSFMSLVGTAT